jgi:hypothetical protein
MEWNSTNDMFGIERFALSGLAGLWASFTQGVALGWFVFAPSGQRRRSYCARRYPVLFVSDQELCRRDEAY